MIKMIRSLALAATTMIPQTAFADMLDRYETAVERGAENINTFLLGRIPDLAGVMPPSDWQEVDREIGRCMLQEIGSQGGDAAVEAHVRRFEEVAETPITSYAGLVELLSTPILTGAALSADHACGQTERSLKLAVESGMMEVLAKPENQRLLMAD
jgi:hypothetical protein